MVSGNAYITVGDPYKAPDQNPFRQGKKGEKLNPFRTKIIPQNAENGNFAKLTYVAEGFKENNKYITTQPLDSRKKGFGSKDAHRRDEFCNDIRTEQYRETLRKEKLLTAESPEVLQDKLDQLLAERASLTASLQSTSGSNGLSDSMRKTFRDDQLHQYDIGRNRTTEFNPRTTKDHFYRYDQDHGKEFGTTGKPASYDFGQSAWNVHYKPPQYGGKSEVKNFYDRSHLNVGSN